jgi:hypothetical protein
MTKKSVFNLPTGPDYVVLYQKNIEAVCSTEAEIRDQIRRTVIHEFGHYFGMDEEQLKDVYSSWRRHGKVLSAMRPREPVLAQPIETALSCISVNSQTCFPIRC